jgi:hypothetical protein
MTRGRRFDAQPAMRMGWAHFCWLFRSRRQAVQGLRHVNTPIKCGTTNGEEFSSMPAHLLGVRHKNLFAILAMKL